VGYEFFGADAFLFGFNEDGGSEVVCGAYMYDVVAFESVKPYEYVGWQISGCNVS
jgi:hypothetical protein